MITNLSDQSKFYAPHEPSLSALRRCDERKKTAPPHRGSLPITILLTLSLVFVPMVEVVANTNLVTTSLDRSLELRTTTRNGDDCVRPQDQIWLISTRDAPCGCPDQELTDYLTFHRCQIASSPIASRAWHVADPESFFMESIGESRTVFFVHGNRVSRGEDRHRGMAVYRALVRQAVDQRPIRFVIWSWPSDQIRGQLKDVRTKSRMCDPASYQLARLLDRMDPKTSIGMAGYSFGSRLITGALHLLGGGRLGSYCLQERMTLERTPIRSVLLSAALDNNWLQPGNRHGLALSQMDRMLVITNHCDPVTKWYRLIDPCRRRRRDRRALGHAGIASFPALGAERHKVEQLDASCYVGKSHDLTSYLDCPLLMARAWSYVSFQDAAAFVSDAIPPNVGAAQASESCTLDGCHESGKDGPRVSST